VFSEICIDEVREGLWEGRGGSSGGGGGVGVCVCVCECVRRRRRRRRACVCVCEEKTLVRLLIWMPLGSTTRAAAADGNETPEKMCANVFGVLKR